MRDHSTFWAQQRMKKETILIADDHALFRTGVRDAVERDGWTVCAEACNGRQALERAMDHKPGFLIADMAMPELNGIEVIRQISSALPSTRAILLTMHHNEEIARSAFEAGARGYVLKSDLGSVLLAAIHSIWMGSTFFTPAIAESVIQSFVKSPKKSDRASLDTSKLSPREREILQLLAEGKRTKEVAAILHTSPATVETQRKNIMHKLRLGTIADLVRYAIRNQFVEA
jgi:DNA-binding NarL/FixJ family response regulator